MYEPCVYEFEGKERFGCVICCPPAGTYMLPPNPNTLDRDDESLIWAWGGGCHKPAPPSFVGGLPA